MPPIKEEQSILNPEHSLEPTCIHVGSARNESKSQNRNGEDIGYVSNLKAPEVPSTLHRAFRRCLHPPFSYYALYPMGFFSALPPWCECGTAEKRQGRIKALHERSYVEL
jgi:hypothetical protein